MSDIVLAAKTVETERRFLLSREVFEDLTKDVAYAEIEQSYLPDCGEWSVRSRKRIFGERASYSVTMKRAICHGSSHEIEMTGTAEGHAEIVAHAGAVLLKRRYAIPLHDGLMLEIDEFRNLGRNLIIAEIEVDNLKICLTLPEGFHDEITGDAEHSNSRIFQGIVAALPAGVRG